MGDHPSFKTPLKKKKNRGAIYAIAQAKPMPGLTQAGCRLLRLHLQFWPGLIQKFVIINAVNTSSVCCTSRPQFCLPDGR